MVCELVYWQRTITRLFDAFCGEAETEFRILMKKERAGYLPGNCPSAGAGGDR